MKALLAFSGGGGSGFPGSPVAGVYNTTGGANFLAVCESVLTVPFSVLINPDGGEGGTIWYSVGDGEAVFLLGGTVSDFASLPALGSFGPVTLAAPPSSAIQAMDSNNFWAWNGSAWVEFAPA